MRNKQALRIPLPPTVAQREELQQFCLSVIKDEKPKLILLFGSFASGEYREDSDVDVLLVYEQLALPYSARFQRFYRFSKGRVYPCAYTVEEIIAMLETENSFISNILDRGVVLYCD